MGIVAIGAVVGYVAASVLFHTVGREWGCLILGLVFCAAWVGHTERSRRIVGLLMDIAERHMPAKTAAALGGVTASRWSEWRSGAEQASLPRLVDGLPDAVLNEWHSEMLAGQGFVVAPSGRFATAASAMLALEAAVRAHAAAILPRQGAA